MLQINEKNLEFCETKNINSQKYERGVNNIRNKRKESKIV